MTCGFIEGGAGTFYNSSMGAEEKKVLCPFLHFPYFTTFHFEFSVRVGLIHLLPSSSPWLWTWS